MLNHFTEKKLRRRVIAADFNGDGLIDLACSELFTHASVLTNDGAGNFELGSSLVVEHPADCIIAADLDGDGRLDLATANYASRNVSLLFNETIFLPASTPPTLSISQAGSGVVVSWLADLPGWTLQKNSGGFADDWGPAGYEGYPITNNGTNQSLRVMANDGTQFFRLIHP
jgi:hypothetical protein